MSEVKCICFDCFGTVFDMSRVPREELREYVEFVRRDPPSILPLKLPTSWESIPAHPDSVEGLARLRKRFVVAAFSNAPLSLMIQMSRNAGIWWDWIVPVTGPYKPHLAAYQRPAWWLGFHEHEILLVTANPTFGDIEGAAAVGMQSQVIRNTGGPQTIIELAEGLVRDE